MSENNHPCFIIYTRQHIQRCLGNSKTKTTKVSKKNSFGILNLIDIVFPESWYINSNPVVVR